MFDVIIYTTGDQNFGIDLEREVMGSTPHSLLDGLDGPFYFSYVHACPGYV